MFRTFKVQIQQERNPVLSYICSTGMKQRAVFEKITLHLSSEVQHTNISLINLVRYK